MALYLSCIVYVILIQKLFGTLIFLLIYIMYFVDVRKNSLTIVY